MIHGTDSGRFPSLEAALYLLSLVYGGAVRIRTHGFHKAILASRRLPCAVISIGNLTVGGTGKTPMTIHVAQRARDLGYKVVILSRGYGGSAGKAGGVVSDGRALRMTPETAGDEPFMMADRLRDIPVVVGRDRFSAGTEAVAKFKPAVLVLDDGFQHRSLMRDLDLVLLDHRHPLGNGHLLPRGPLREPLSALARGDAFILTRCDADDDGQSAATLSLLQTGQTIGSDTPVFRSFHIPRVLKIIRTGADPGDAAVSTEDGSEVAGRLVFAFSGIARNDDFRSTVEGLGCRLAGFKAFPDHYPYRHGDVDHLKRVSEASGAELILTTEKDAVRIPDGVSWPVDLVVIGLDIAFRDPDDGPGAFDTFLEERLKVIVNR